MKKILCPIDFSDTANNAVEYAANLAQHFKAELSLLHVVEEMALRDTLDTKIKMSPMEKEQHVEEKMRKYCEVTADSFSISCKPLVAIFNSGIEAGISKETEEAKYDLIVMGTNGTSDMEELLLGTHTYQVIRKTACPLLLIPQNCSFSLPKRIVYASDYKTEDVEALKRLIQFVEMFDAEITVLHISKEHSTKSQEVFSCFRDLYQTKVKQMEINFKQLVSKSTAAALDTYVIENQSDILVLLTHHYSLIERIFHNSVTKEMSALATYPVLISNTSEMKGSG